MTEKQHAFILLELARAGRQSLRASVAPLHLLRGDLLLWPSNNSHDASVSWRSDAKQVLWEIRVYSQKVDGGVCDWLTGAKRRQLQANIKVDIDIAPVFIDPRPRLVRVAVRV